MSIISLLFLIVNLFENEKSYLYRIFILYQFHILMFFNSISVFHIPIITNIIYINIYIIIMHCGNVGILMNKGIASG